MSKAGGELTFRDLDGDIQLNAPTGPLEEWYALQRDTPIGEMGIADLARCCRQRLFPEVVIPAALKNLRRTSFSGDWDACHRRRDLIR